MDETSRPAIEKLAQETFSVACEEGLEDRSKRESQALAMASRTGNSATYPNALTQLARVRVREDVVAYTDALVDSLNRHRAAADEQIDKTLEAVSRQFAGGAVSWAEGELNLYCARTRRNAGNLRGHLHGTVEHARVAAVKKGKLKLEQQRTTMKIAAADPAQVRARNNAVLLEAWRRREPVQQIEDTLRPLIPGIGDARGKGFLDSAWAYLRLDPNLQMPRSEFDNLCAEDLLALFTRLADRNPRGATDSSELPNQQILEAPASIEKEAVPKTSDGTIAAGVDSSGPKQRPSRGPKPDNDGHLRTAELLADKPWQDDLRGACEILDHPPDNGGPVSVSEKWKKDGVRGWVHAFDDMKTEPEIEKAIERKIKLGAVLRKRPS